MASPTRKRSRLDFEDLIMSFDMRSENVAHSGVGVNRGGSVLQGDVGVVHGWDGVKDLNERGSCGESSDVDWGEFCDSSDEGDGNVDELHGNIDGEGYERDKVNSMANDGNEDVGAMEDSGSDELDFGVDDWVECGLVDDTREKENDNEVEETNGDSGIVQDGMGDDVEEESDEEECDEEGVGVDNGGGVEGCDGVDAIVECLKMMKESHERVEGPPGSPVHAGHEENVDNVEGEAAEEGDDVSQYGIFDEICRELLDFLHEEELCHEEESLDAGQVRQIVLNHFMEHRIVGQGKVNETRRESVRCADEFKRGVARKCAKKGKAVKGKQGKVEDPESKFYNFVTFMFDLDTSSEYMGVMGAMGILNRDVKFFNKIPHKNMRDRFDRMRKAIGMVQDQTREHREKVLLALNLLNNKV